MKILYETTIFNGKTNTSTFNNYKHNTWSLVTLSDP